MSLDSTFIAALRSVGTAATLASAGFYLHRRGFVTPEGKKGFARLSEQVTIPCLFFSKIVNCPQNFSEDKCPNITDNLADVWVLLFWPLFVVGMGIMIGNIAATVSGTPQRQRKAVIAAVAFANSTGLPITLLTVVHANFPQTTELGRVDPNLFLSVYLILYPILQWGIGGWLLAPGENEDDIEIQMNGSARAHGIHHVLNLPEAEETMAVKSEAAARMIKELSLSSIVEWQQSQDRNGSNRGAHHHGQANNGDSVSLETTQLVPLDKPLSSTLFTDNETTQFVSIDRPLSSTFSAESLTALARDLSNDVAPLMETMTKVIPRALQPPVIGALSGIFIACIPALRGLLVDLDTRADNAPLEWFFDGIYSIGLAAVPINMCILGINLSITSMKKTIDAAAQDISSKTIAAIVIAKMIIMPIIGILTTLVLKNYIWHIPEDIDAPFYLVLMIVTITPTANNVMVMMEISGSGSKEGMARIIAWQYAVAPVVLSISVMIVVSVVCLW